MDNNLMYPLSTLQWVDRKKLKANDWNPNKVSRENLDLLVKSILANGWTLPIVCRPDYTIIDGFHRWTVAGEEPLKTMLKGKVPIVFRIQSDESGDVYGTVTHNRARGTHLLEPMKNIVKRLLSQGKSIKEISKALGMKQEEIFRLTDISKEEFLKLMASRSDGYSKELYMRKI
jgi:ParB-like chromosome segregation protein Spo0J